MKLFNFPARNLTLGLVALSSGLALGAIDAHAQEKLVIVGWGGSLQAIQRQVYFEPFTAETGIQIVEDEWGGEMAKLRAMVEAGATTWDVVAGSDAQVAIGCSEGLLEPLDFANFGGADRFVPDAVHECGVGTSTSAGVFAFNADKITGEQPTTLKDFFDVERFPGPRALRKNPKILLESALLADGVPVADLYNVLGTEEGLARAFKVLDRVKPTVKVWFTQWAEGLQLLVDGEVHMTHGGNARFWLASHQDGKNIKVVWDHQSLGYDFWSVAKGSKNSDAAIKFIEFASRDENMENFTKLFRYGPTVKTVIESMPPEIAVDMPTAPQNMTTYYRIDQDFWIDHNDDYTAKFNAWLQN